MYYKEFKTEHISALGMGSLRLPMEKGNADRIDREEAQKVIDQALILQPSFMQPLIQISRRYLKNS